MPRTAIHLRTFLSFVAAALFCGAPSPCYADYCYAWTELSWEWLTDASRAIVVGQITAVREPGFELKVERLLKCRDLKIEAGDIVTSPVLGRSRVDGLEFTDCLLPEIGWPSLLDPRTYPAKSEIRDRPWRPKFYREKSWVCGDRGLVFFGDDLQCPLQVINLDRPVTIEVEFLAVDMVGQIVSKADDLLKRIESRLATTVDELGQPRVCSAAIVHGADSPINSQDYFHFLAPPDRRLFASQDSLASPKKTETRVGLAVTKNAFAPQAVGYWYLPGQSTKQYATDAREERDAAVKAMLYEHDNCPYCQKTPLVGVGDVCRNQIYRQHRTNHRTYPLGWLCTLSYDRKYIAFLNGYLLQVYTVDESAERPDRLVLERRDVHQDSSYVEFSQNGRLLTYATADGGICLINLRENRVLWTAKAAVPVSGRPTRTTCLEFSHDPQYLAQQSGAVVHVWDVVKGEVVFSPFEPWRVDVEYVSFHPQDSSRIRLQDVGRPDGVGGIWSVTEGKLLQSLGSLEAWPSE